MGSPFLYVCSISILDKAIDRFQVGWADPDTKNVQISENFGHPGIS